MSINAKNAVLSGRSELMGKVAVTFRVMPKDVKVDLGKLKEKIREAVNVQDMQEEPIAFGLVALKVLVVVDDAAGGTDKIENMLKKIREVKGVETFSITLL